MAVHAAGRKQAHHVQRAVVLDRLLAGVDQLRVVEEAAAVDRGVDPGQLLVHHPAGADVHVADLGVAHLAVGQADEAALGVDQRGRAGLPQPAPVGHIGLGDGVVARILAVAPAVQDQQDHGFRAVCSFWHVVWPCEQWQVRL
jgi:hypothetical protein